MKRRVTAVERREAGDTFVSGARFPDLRNPGDG
jgi:hypothetical protein